MPNSEWCSNPEVSSKVLTFFANFRSGFRFAYFVYIAYCATQRSEFVTFPKTLRNKSLHEKVKKRSHHVANPRESQKDRRQKIWWGEETDHALRCLCFTQWICRSSFNRFVLPGEVVRWVFLLVLLEKLSRKKKSFLCLSCLKNRAEIKHSLLVLLEK